jgi:hypothetical protein
MLVSAYFPAIQEPSGVPHHSCIGVCRFVCSFRADRDQVRRVPSGLHRFPCGGNDIFVQGVCDGHRSVRRIR